MHDGTGDGESVQFVFLVAALVACEFRWGI